jgi:hypothetical protein
VLDLYEELIRLISALEEQKIEYALCGGLAMAVWAFPRATVDIDLLVEPQSVEAVERVGETLGYKIKARPMNFSSDAIKIHRITKVDPAGGDVLMLDLLVVTPMLQDVWTSRTRVEWDGGSIAVVSREGLVKMKTFRSSGTDLDDIKHLEGEQ